MRASSFALAAVLSVAPGFVGAVPRTPTEAEILFGRGVEAFEAGRYETAAALLSQAYALEPEARLAFNTGLAYERAGREEEAVTWYRLAAASDEPALRGEAAAAILRLSKGGSQPRTSEPSEEQSQARLRFALAAPAEGARVSVDGGQALALPGIVTLKGGTHLIEAAAPGYVPWQKTVTLSPGEEQAVSIQLTPVAVESGIPTWWFGAGVTGAATAAGVGFYFASSGHFDEAERLSKEGADRVGFDRAQSDGRSAASLSNASYGVAALAGAVTGLLWWLERDDGLRASGVSVLPILGPYQAGVVGSWRL